jgi:hypothetical protein
LIGPIHAGIVDNIASDMGVSTTFCYVIIAILALTLVFAIIGWIAGSRRRKREQLDLKKKICPACGGENKHDELLCKYCEEML